LRCAKSNANLPRFQAYDLVGDIHGHANALHRLLRALDYTEIEGVFRHPKKQMILVGDFIDRGPPTTKMPSVGLGVCQSGSGQGPSQG
jgi:hypothetical protein